MKLTDATLTFMQNLRRDLLLILRKLVKLAENNSLVSRTFVYIMPPIVLTRRLGRCVGLKANSETLIETLILSQTT